MKPVLCVIAAIALVPLLLLPQPHAGIYETWPPAKTGITWRHDNAMSSRRYQPESVGPGVAIFDYNNDGRMDIYFPNSGPADFFKPSTPLHAALYRNNGDGTFTDVTAQAGLATQTTFGIGVAAADYDGDGFTDLLVTGYGHNVLYRNRGNGTFEDVTKRAGLNAPGFSTSAVWFDYDNDGKPDLFIASFVRFSKALEQDCRTAGVNHYCYPISYDPQPSRLYRNRGDGSFEDVSGSSGIASHPGKSFGAVAVDIDSDGYPDLYVSNDSVPNFLFHNLRNGRFEEIGLEAGVAYSDDGVARSGMGVDSGDYDGDGLPDLFVANLTRERFSLYRNLGSRTFRDVAGPSNLGQETYMFSGWGSKLVDFDNDGDLDLILANGHPDDLIESARTGLKWKEPLLLLENRGGRFVNRAADAGTAFHEDYPSRGLAVGDLDNDGWPDLVIANNGAAPVIVHHRGGTNHWLGFTDLPAGSVIRWPQGIRFVTAGGSYLSSCDPRVVIGLGKAKPDWVEIEWPAPHHQRQRIEHPAVDRYLPPQPAPS